ncbi:MAG: hypothetical protein HFG53_12225 [Lachnospiraceae bacterium]|jgi:hypothetical protein|nr:hypothetical protein [Lachnospiraceae bacterium]
MNNTCFVIMPIGDQAIGGVTITEEKLREKYDYIIKNAIKKAAPSLDVIRADEEVNPGSISNDIFTKLMHSQFVIADITYPNPNVFYELGIRHAIRPGTILIREKVDFKVPFDVSHLRHIEYTQEPSGMDKLAEQLKRRFEFYAKTPEKPDNQFLELCSFTNYVPTIYGKPETGKQDFVAKLLTLFLSNPGMLQALTDKSLSKEDQQQAIFLEFAKNPDYADQLVQALVHSGLIQI